MARVRGAYGRVAQQTRSCCTASQTAQAVSSLLMTMSWAVWAAWSMTWMLTKSWLFLVFSSSDRTRNSEGVFRWCFLVRKISWMKAGELHASQHARHALMYNLNWPNVKLGSCVWYPSNESHSDSDTKEHKCCICLHRESVPFLDRVLVLGVSLFRLAFHLQMLNLSWAASHPVILQSRQRDVQVWRLMR